MRLMTLTTYFWASLLICGQSFRVTCVILVEIQPTGINGRAENKIKQQVHAQINVEWRFTRSFNSKFSGKTNSGWPHITGFCNFTVCPPCQPGVKCWFILVFGSQAGGSLGPGKNECPLLWGLTAFTMMCTHPADLIWLQKLRVL